MTRERKRQPDPQRDHEVRLTALRLALERARTPSQRRLILAELDRERASAPRGGPCG